MTTLVERLGWMLLHSLWQGLAIALLLEIALVALRRQSAATRHAVACAALAAMILLPALTFGSMDFEARFKAEASPVNLGIHAQSHSVPTGERSPVVMPPPNFESPGWKSDNLVRGLLPVLVAFWIGGMALWSLRLVVAWRFMQRLAGLPLPALTPEWQKRFDLLLRRAGVHRLVRLGESLAVSGPLIIGWAKPVILLPIGALTQLSPEQVEAIILHELAHLRRNDFLVNLLQCVAEAIFFYHPAIHWVNARIRREREWACDDLTVTWCADPLGYARALEAFESNREPSFALAATGGNLLERIRRIVLGTQPKGPRIWVFGLAGLLAVGTYLLALLLVPALAARAMSGRERVELIDSARAEGTGDALLPRDSTKEITVEGILRTEDGQPLPKEVVATSLLRNFGGSICQDLNIGKDGHFSRTMLAGRASLAVWAEGYAPLYFRYKTEDFLHPIDLILPNGMPARVRISDPEGKPIEGATLSILALGGDVYPNLALPAHKTDSSGLVTLGQVMKDTVLGLSFRKPGWEMSEKKIGSWSEGSVVNWTIRPSLPTTCVVVDRATQIPIAGVSVRLASSVNCDGRDVVNGDPFAAPLLGTSDAEGKFRLEDFNRDDGYTLYLLAPGYEPGTLRITGSELGVGALLKRGLAIRGKILDPQGLLEKISHPDLTVDTSIQTTPTCSYGYNRKVSLSPDGLETSFAVEELAPGDVTLQVANRSYPVKLTDHDINDFVIDLGVSPRVARAPNKPTRTVHIKLVPPRGQPEVTGGLGISLQHALDPSYSRTETSPYQPVVNGVATFNVPRPNKISFYPDHLIGYWFKQTEIDVDDQEKELTRTIDVLPAGAIHGRITSDPALRERYYFCSAITIKPNPAWGDVSLGGMGQSSDSNPLDHYVSDPLPIGGTYAIVLWSGNTFAVSPPIAITAEKPVVTCDMHRVEGTTLRGVFVDREGKPLARKAITIEYQPGNHGFSTDCGYTGSDGSFAIPQVNLNVPGYYTLSLVDDNHRQYRPSAPIDASTPRPLHIVWPPDPE